MKKLTALVTAGPTREKIDPVRFISNFSSGKQGYAIAKALYEAGYEVTLVSGPVNINASAGIKVIQVESAEEMLGACLSALPTDIAICTAAVCDYRACEISDQKIKKAENISEINIKLIKNPDILKTISNYELRPKIVVGFAAETENLIQNATKKLQTKNCDIIVANNVAENDIFGRDTTYVSIITHNKTTESLIGTKDKVAKNLVSLISNMLMHKNI